MRQLHDVHVRAELLAGLDTIHPGTTLMLGVLDAADVQREEDRREARRRVLEIRGNRKSSSIG
jgi:hypothetical protein